MWSSSVLVPFLLLFILNLLYTEEQLIDAFIDKYYRNGNEKNFSLKKFLHHRNREVTLKNKPKLYVKSEINNKNSRNIMNENDEDYLMQYATNFAFKNLDEFGLQVKYYKTEHVLYGNSVPNPTQLKTENSKVDKTPMDDVHTTALYGSYVFPYVNRYGSWQVMRESKEEMFPKGFKPRTSSNFRVNFYFYTRKNGENMTDIRQARQLIESDFSNKRKTIFIIPGWQNGEDKTYILPEIRRAFLKVGDYNVFMVDWSNPSWIMNYFTAAHFTQLVGNKIADFIKLLVDHRDSSLSKVKLVGHSLGAHAAGVAGKKLKGKIRSIVGLDPARLLFSKRKHAKDKYLDSSDAQYVEVSHTSLIGIFEPSGDVDYFFNNGYAQPECWLLDMTCDHSKVNEYFLKSIMNPKEFALQKCESLHHLKNNTCATTRSNRRYINGNHPDTKLSGIYNVNTRSVPYVMKAG